MVEVGMIVVVTVPVMIVVVEGGHLDYGLV
jgi:hypothetical protein